ncbi:hypothetical protein ACJQWK_10134 [Exserohilum turcicum]
MVLSSHAGRQAAMRSTYNECTADDAPRHKSTVGFQAHWTCIKKKQKKEDGQDDETEQDWERRVATAALGLADISQLACWRLSGDAMPVSLDRPAATAGQPLTRFGRPS